MEVQYFVLKRDELLGPDKRPRSAGVDGSIRERCELLLFENCGDFAGIDFRGFLMDLPFHPVACT